MRFFLGSSLIATVLGGATACAQLPPTNGAFNGPATVIVPFRTMYDLVVIPVTINGHGPLQLILDTGAPLLVVLNKEVVPQLKLNVVGQIPVGGAGDGERQTSPFATGITASVGGYEVRNSAGIVGAGAASDILKKVDGIIGAPLFQHAIVEIDWDARVVRFHDPARAPVMRGDTLPLTIKRSLHVSVPTAISVNGAPKTLDLELDTGANGALSVSRDALATIGATPRASISMLTGYGSRGASRGEFIRTDTLRLGGVALHSIPTAVPGNEPGETGRIGLPVLQRFHVYFDYPGKRLILRPRANRADPFPFTTVGISLQPGVDSMPRVVAEVLPGSPGADAGVMVGDIITAVGGRSVTLFSEEEIRPLLRYPAPGSTVTVSLRRGGETIERSIAARVILP
jgi:predicted aspartyl protease